MYFGIVECAHNSEFPEEQLEAIEARIRQEHHHLVNIGAVQSGITNDLQIKRGAQSIKNRITCNDATSYDEIMEVFEDIFEHVKKLELASLHAISKRMEYNTDSNVAGNVVNLFEKKEENNLDIDLDINIDEEIDTEKFEIVMREAEIAFKELTRMGFSAENLENDMYIEAFRIGAGALINIKYQFERFFRELSKLQKSGKELGNYFVKDKQIFSNQFEAIYGENL